MSAIDRSIGGEGLEQGGPNMGNDYTRKDLGVRNAGDGLLSSNTPGMNSGDDDSLNIDKESSRNLSGESDDASDEIDEIDLDEVDLDDDELLDEDDDDEEEELKKGL
ncbi:MAG: hypothetical protein WKF89_06535 [Chitinophagaceae bacterium]